MKKIDKLLVWIYKTLYRYFGSNKVYKYLYVEGYPEGANMSYELNMNRGLVKTFSYGTNSFGEWIYNKYEKKVSSKYDNNISLIYKQLI